MAMLEQQKGFHSGTEVRKGRSVCRERRFWLEMRRVSWEQDYRKFENSTWDFHQRERVLHLIKTLRCFRRNLRSSKFQTFIKRPAEKQINKSSSGKKELCWKTDGWDGHLGLSHISLQKCAGSGTGSLQQSLHQGCCGASCQSRHARVYQKAQHSSTCWSLLLPEAMIRSKTAQKSKQKVNTHTHGCIICNRFTATKEGLNPYQISKPFRHVWNTDELE